MREEMAMGADHFNASTRKKEPRPKPGFFVHLPVRPSGEVLRR